MAYGLVVIVLAGVVAIVVTAPLRVRYTRGAEQVAERRSALEAARDAKYREIRDAELDFQMGKISEADFKASDRELRDQAINILEALDQLNGSGPH